MSFKAAKAVWIGLAMIVLVVALYGFDGKPNSDIGVFLLWSMLILAFPASVIVALVLTGISLLVEKLFSTVIPTSYWWIVTSWICFFAAGYVQWFVLLPWLWRKWRTRDVSGAASSPG
jgi:hypothetical protein